MATGTVKRMERGSLTVRLKSESRHPSTGWSAWAGWMSGFRGLPECVHGPASGTLLPMSCHQRRTAQATHAGDAGQAQSWMVGHDGGLRARHVWTDRMRCSGWCRRNP